MTSPVFSGDPVVGLAMRAEATLSVVGDGADHFEEIDSGLRDALEAARVFRAQLDLGGGISIARLQLGLKLKGDNTIDESSMPN